MKKAQNDIKALDKDLKNNYSFEKSKSYGANREKIMERLGKNEKLMKQYHKEARKWENLPKLSRERKRGTKRWRKILLKVL